MLAVEVISGNSPWVTAFVLVVVLLGVVGLVSLGVRTIFGVGHNGSRGRATADPELILKMRLAGGEIDSDEYERLLGLIRDDR